jgi:hypothetical protein
MNNEMNFEEIKRTLHEICDYGDEDLIQFAEDFIEEISQCALNGTDLSYDFHIRFQTRLHVIRAKQDIETN